MLYSKHEKHIILHRYPGLGHTSGRRSAHSRNVGGSRIMGDIMDALTLPALKGGDSSRLAATNVCETLLRLRMGLISRRYRLMALSEPTLLLQVRVLHHVCRRVLKNRI